MNQMSDATFASGSRDFGDGVSESSFGQDAGAGGNAASDHGSTLRDAAVDKLRSFADLGKDQVTGSLDGIVAAAREIAAKVGDNAGPLGAYAHSAVDTLEGWAGIVKDKSIEDLIDDGRDFARRSPAAAVAIAVVAGFAISRLLRVSNGNQA